MVALSFLAWESHAGVTDTMLGRHEAFKELTRAHIAERKATNPNYRVIEVGGAEFATHAFVDIFDQRHWFVAESQHNSVAGFNNSMIHFSGDINMPSTWEPVLAYVRANGKFDFSVCMHTLEDIVNPLYVTEMLSLVSDTGFVAVPSKYVELALLDNEMPYAMTCGGRVGACERYHGYLHHRWVFTIQNGHLVAAPKLAWLERTTLFDKKWAMADKKFLVYDSVAVFWEGSVGLQTQQVLSLDVITWTLDLLLYDDLETGDVPVVLSVDAQIGEIYSDAKGIEVASVSSSPVDKATQAEVAEREHAALLEEALEQSTS